MVTLDPNSPAPPSAIVPLGLAGYTLPLCTNFILTTLIVGRIWYFACRVRTYAISTSGDLGRSRTSLSREVINVLIESGALYFAAQLVFVVLFGLGHPAQAIVAVMTTQIYVRDTSCQRRAPLTSQCRESHLP